MTRGKMTITALGAVSLLVIYLASDVFILVVFSVLLAYVLSPLAGLLERILKPLGPGRGLRRAVSLVVVIGVVLLVFTTLYFTLPILARQLQSLGQNTPRYIEKIRALIEENLRESEQGTLTSLWWSALEKQLAEATTAAASFVGRNLLVAFAQLFHVVSLLVIPFVCFYILYEGPRMKEYLLRLVPERQVPKFRSLMSDIDLALASYVRGQSLVCLAMMGLTIVGFLIIGLDYAVALGIMAGLLEVVPFLGFVVAVLVVTLVGLAQAPTTALKAVIYYVAVTQLMNFAFTPRIFAHHMRLHPALVVVALMAGAKLGGVVGVLLALPTTAVAKAVIWNWRAATLQPEGGADSDEGKE